jgi:C_GCAxxG_C_C family probable redox protein
MGLALKVSAPFRAGMGRLGRTCGAVTGAFMVLGLKFTDTDAGNAESRDRICALVREFEQEYRRKNGSSICSELVGCDVSNPEERDRAARNGTFLTLCPRLVRDAAEIVGEMIGYR